MVVSQSQDKHIYNMLHMCQKTAKGIRIFRFER